MMPLASRLVLAVVVLLIGILTPVRAYGGYVFRAWGLPICNDNIECKVSQADCIDALNKVDEVYTSVGEESALVVTSGTCTLKITIPFDGCSVHRNHLFYGIPKDERGGLNHVLEQCLPFGKCGQVKMWHDPEFEDDPGFVPRRHGCPWTVEVTQSGV